MVASPTLSPVSHVSGVCLHSLPGDLKSLVTAERFQLVAYISEEPQIQLLFPPLCRQPTGRSWHRRPLARGPGELAWTGSGGYLPPGISLLAAEASQCGQSIHVGPKSLLGRVSAVCKLFCCCCNKSVFLARLWLSFSLALRGPCSSPSKECCGEGRASPWWVHSAEAILALALSCPTPCGFATQEPRRVGVLLAELRTELRRGGGVAPLHVLSLGIVLGGCPAPPLQGCQHGQAQLPGG